MNQKTPMESRLDRLEAVQAMLLEIGQLSIACSDITEFISAVHRSLGRIMYAANFYVALGDPASGTVRFVYFVDEVDATPDPRQQITLAAAEQSPTVWVMAHRRSLVMTAAEDKARRPDAAGWGVGSTAEHWMGCPLLDQQQQAQGVIVIQSYTPGYAFSA